MWDEEEIAGAGAPGTQLAHEPHVAMSIAATPDDSGGIMGRLVAAAQGLERDPRTLIDKARQIGGLLGSDGFYRFPAGNTTVEGPSIDMAQALAQVWGGIVYQVRIVHTELLASGGQRVHLRATVADMRSLVVAEVDQVISTSAPPGKFANSVEQSERWHGMQTQSAASKIVRNAILRVIPDWFVKPAFVAAKTIDSDQALKGMSLPEARKGAADAVVALGAKIEEIEQFLGSPYEMWAVPQISQLRQLYKQLKSSAQSIEAWRASLAEKGAPGNGTARKSALGLSAASSSKPVDVPTNGAGEKAPVESAQPAKGKVAKKDAEPASAPQTESERVFAFLERFNKARTLADYMIVASDLDKVYADFNPDNQAALSECGSATAERLKKGD